MYLKFIFCFIVFRFFFNVCMFMIYFYVQIFGCDDVFLGGIKEFDECGVCGGDGFICDVIQGIFMGIFGEGNLFCDI